MTDRIDHWRSDASCSGMGASWDALTVNEQISMCRGCPVAVATECLAYGWATDACGVVYGGRFFPEHTRRSTILEGLIPE